MRISDNLKPTTTGHCFTKLNKYCHPSALQLQKRGWSNRKEIRLFYRYRWNTYQRGEEQNREEGEIGSESREKGDLLPCPPPSYQVSFTPNTWYLHAWKVSVTMVTINLTFVQQWRVQKHVSVMLFVRCAHSWNIFSTRREISCFHAAM